MIAYISKDQKSHLSTHKPQGDFKDHSSTTNKTVKSGNGTVTEHGVTEQRSYSDSDPDFVCTITWLVAHYFSSLR